MQKITNSNHMKSAVNTSDSMHTKSSVELKYNKKLYVFRRL